MMAANHYRRIMLRFEGSHFSIYCTQHSLENRREALDRWIALLASRLRWEKYSVLITGASKEQALERELALFENRHPHDAP
jgi:hypothetical protein